MSARDENEYLLGTHDAELTRLALQHRIWAEEAHAIWRRAGFAPGQTLLDVGCGPGDATVDLAQIVGDRGKVVAIDMSPRFLEYIRQRQRALGLQQIHTVQSDVQALDLPGNSADGAYSRWVLCWTPHPERVVAAVAKSLRPGGVFAVQDYFNYRSLALAPRSAAFERVIAAIVESYRARQADCDVAGRLPEMMDRCGLTVTAISPIARVARPGSLLWEWPTTFFRNYVPALVREGFLDEAAQRAFEEDWAARSRDPHSFFCTPPVYDIIAVKR